MRYDWIDIGLYTGRNDISMIKGARNIAASGRIKISPRAPP